MKNVLQFIGSFHQGGSERQAVQLVRLLRENASLNVFAATLNKEGILLDEIEKTGLTQIPEFKLNSFYDANFLLQMKNCVRFLRENKIEIVHTHDFYTNVFGIAAARLAGVKCKIASKRETSAVRSKAQKIIEKRIFKMADAIVANSEAVKNYLIRDNVSAEKIKVIYNGLDLSRVAPNETNRKKICAEFGLPDEEKLKFITLVANLRHEVKNQPMFLRAAQAVLRKFPDAHFVLAGEGELKNDLENLAKKLKIEKNTHFIGRCTKIAELLSISYVCVLTSRAEGFSNSILEYMAAGKPVVATNVGGAAEVIIENETGFLVESEDDEMFAKRLMELLEDDDKAARFGEKGKKIVREKFSLANQLNKTLELYGFCEYYR
ncbi:MAG TPA: glycosyltransferase [Pyrinomonadaceae bacterium]|jgi:glycosyltransferase involved in cell wall biosynthesis